MNAYTGTTSKPVAGHSFTNGSAPCILAPATGLTVTITVGTGADIEHAQITANGKITSTWTTHPPGDQLTITEGERILIRPRAPGGASVAFQWTGAERLAALAAYQGLKGQSPYAKRTT